jgi:excisionase family DNA binding protein
MGDYFANFVQDLQKDIALAVEAGIRVGVQAALSKSHTNSKVEYLSKKEAAAYLNLSSVTLHTYIKQGLIPSYRIAGSIRLIKEDLDKAFMRRKF